MKVGERIKEARKKRNISVESLAAQLGVSKTTIYRYEDSTIEKIPVHVFDKLCQALAVSPAELMGNAQNQKGNEDLPAVFYSAQDAMEFLLKTPTLAAYGGYDPDSMSEETLIAFANEILHQLKLVSYKYKYPENRG